MYKSDNQDGEEKYSQMKKNINKLFNIEKDDEGCLREITEFYRTIRREKADKENFRFVHVAFARAYNHLNKQRYAIEHITRAEKYITDETEKTKIIIVKWQKGICYKGIDNKKAQECLEQAYEMSAGMQCYESMGGILEELYTITNNENYLLTAIYFYKLTEPSSLIDKESTLNAMYTRLFNIYILKNDIENSFKILSNITNESLVKKLRKKIFRIA